MGLQCREHGGGDKSENECGQPLPEVRGFGRGRAAEEEESELCPVCRRVSAVGEVARKWVWKK